MMHLIGLLFSLWFVEISTFNIDTNNFIVYVDPQKPVNSSLSPNYFGYTVLLYPGNRNGHGKWVKIGAPKGRDIKMRHFKNTGVVYECPIMKSCSPVDVKGGYFDQTDLMDDAWIGGSMDINYRYERLVICGYRAKTLIGIDHCMIGFCYLANVNSSFDQITPLEDRDRRLYASKVYYYGQGQAGFSTHFPEHENSLILGAPGVFNWAGTIIKANDIINGDPIASKYRTKSKRALSVDFFTADAKFSKISIASDILGYSVTSGHFYGPNQLYYVTSTPKNGNCKGKVVLVTFNENGPLILKTAVVGQQFCEYFGASVTAGDLNNDGFDDLVVSAPFHATKSYNEGAVYIFLGKKAGQLKNQHILYGQQTNGQFGTAVMFLGDMNNDGFGDLAIGAPYEEEFSGAIYIYRGNKEGLELQPCQRIVGKQISSSIQGFGISISRPADMDGNGFKDLLVGAHLSGNAVLLKTSPIVVVEYNMSSIPKVLNPETTEFLLNICYTYSHFDKVSSREYFELNRIIVVDEILNRAVLKNVKHGTKIIKITKPICENIPVKLKNTDISHPAPVKISLSYSLVNNASKEIVYISDKHINGTDNFCVRCPVLDRYRSTPPNFIEVPFSLNCGDDNVCESALSIDAKFPELNKSNTFVVGSRDYLNMEVTIRNDKENAFSTQVEVVLPEVVNFGLLPAACYEQNVSAIICNIDNRLERNSKRTLVLNLEMKKVNKNNDKDEVDIILRVITTSNNTNPDTNILKLGLRREADIMISGKSGQQSVPYGNSTYGMPNFTQMYQVEKFGASPLEKVQVTIMVPHAIKASSGEVSFLKVYPPEGVFAGQPVICTSNFKYVVETNTMGTYEKLEPETSLLRRKRQVEVFKDMNGKKTEDILIEGKEYDLVPNRTYFLNCSTENVVCSSIVCTLGPFEKRQAPAYIKIKVMFDTSAISDMIERKDVILYSTEGTAMIQIPPKFIQHGDRPDSVRVSTLLINEVAKKRRIALWIIILAAIIGVLLFALIVYGLTKTGFFKRTKKEELKNLKARTQDLIDAEATAEVVEPEQGINCSTEGLVDDEQQEIK